MKYMGGTSAGAAAALLLSLTLCVLRPIATAAQWVEVTKPCPKGCTDNGNCNIEQGRCDCNFGFQGPACEVNAAPACRSADKPGALVWYGGWYPKACECYKQLRDYNCQDVTDQNKHCQDFLGWTGRQCYERIDLPREKQLSDLPEKNATDVKWYDRFTDRERGQTDVGDYSHGTERDVVPLKYCPDRCNEQGFCLYHKIELKYYCSCHKSFDGPSCKETIWDRGNHIYTCPNKCQGRGKCLGGFCHCDPPWFGVDCTRSKAYEPAPGATLPPVVHTRPRIYMYELPSWLVFPVETEDGQPTYDRLYSAFDLFFEGFTTDWAVRTENPYEANLFYVPAQLYYHSGNTGDPGPHMVRVVAYLKKNYPTFWNRNQGKDHFFFATADRGACRLPNTTDLNNMIKVVHFGMTKLKMFTEYGQTRCFNPARDIVVPAWKDDNDGAIRNIASYFTPILAGEEPPRKYLMFFVGGYREYDPTYSGGSRQALKKWVYEHPESKSTLKIEGGGDYSEATFCFTPYGHGWGSRLFHMVLKGCIPVIVQEYVHQPFHDVLPYEEFSIRISHDDIPNLLHILRSVPKEQVQAMQRALYKVWPALVWQLELGGEAYNYTIKSLFKRAHNLWANKYHHHLRS